MITTVAGNGWGCPAPVGPSPTEVAVLDDGTVWAWGWNGVGQVGDGTVVSPARPVPAPGTGYAITVGAGGVHSLAA